MIDMPVIGAKVRLNDQAHIALGNTRIRDRDLVGEVMGHDYNRPKFPRALVQWDEPIKHVEPISPQYLELVP